MPVTARLDAASHVRRGTDGPALVRHEKVRVFDVDSGLNLAPGGEDATTSSGAQRA